MGAVKSKFSPREYLRYYIERSDYPNIQKTLEKNPELLERSITNQSKMTPLFKACFNGDMKMVSFFVEKCGANVNTVTEAGQTAIMVAARRNHLKVVRYLLERGADVNTVAPVGLSTLEYAILPGFYEISLLIYERVKEKQLRPVEQFEELRQTYHYRYVNYTIFIENLKKKIEVENVPDFLTKPKIVYKDPVVDPRETWKEWAHRQLEFKDPPLVEREELPEDLQPQNRKFGKFNHFFSNLTMSPMVHQKPTFSPKSKHAGAASSNELQRSQPSTLEEMQVRSAI